MLYAELAAQHEQKLLRQAVVADKAKEYFDSSAPYKALLKTIATNPRAWLILGVAAVLGYTAFASDQVSAAHALDHLPQADGHDLCPNNPDLICDVNDDGTALTLYPQNRSGFVMTEGEFCQAVEDNLAALGLDDGRSCITNQGEFCPSGFSPTAECIVVDNGFGDEWTIGDDGVDLFPGYSAPLDVVTAALDGRLLTAPTPVVDPATIKAAISDHLSATATPAPQSEALALPSVSTEEPIDLEAELAAFADVAPYVGGGLATTGLLVIGFLITQLMKAPKGSNSTITYSPMQRYIPSKDDAVYEPLANIYKEAYARGGADGDKSLYDEMNALDQEIKGTHARLVAAHEKAVNNGDMRSSSMIQDAMAGNFHDPDGWPIPSKYKPTPSGSPPMPGSVFFRLGKVKAAGKYGKDSGNGLNIKDGVTSANWPEPQAPKDNNTSHRKQP